MNLDIRLPIGALFALLGLLLTAFGALGGADYRRSLGQNVNFWWGLAMLAFGLLFLFLGRKGTATARPAETDPEGRETEAREHALGLERESS